MFKVLIFILLSSCAVTYKKDRPEYVAKRVKTEQEIAEQKRKEALADETKWQHQYYEQVMFKVQNPIIVDNNTKLDGICNGDEFMFKESYQYRPLTAIKFKKTPISIKTRSGFSKKIYVTKGACREIQLFRTKKGDSSRIRQAIKQMNILYVYNVGSYLLDITFKTKFRDVEFFVK